MTKQSSAPMNQKISQSLQSVLMIFNADPHLMNITAPYINVENETIQWREIKKIPFNEAHRCAVDWAYAMWTNCPTGSLFAIADKMHPFMKVAVLEALCLHWKLRG